MKQVLTVQDLSCMGKCSITVALPVLSAMGCACSVLPTAVLSTHTAFPEPHCVSLTQELVPMAEHIRRVGGRFDAVSVGYLSDPGQAQQVLEVLELFEAPLVLDPVMGDHGRLYSRLTQEHVQALRPLCGRARCVLPNVTEAALLTGLPYCEQVTPAQLDALADGLLALGAESAVITGFRWDSGEAGFYACDGGERCSYRAPHIPKTLHGTGDLFAAVFTGALVRGSGIAEAARAAAGFVEQVVGATPDRSPYGLHFEPLLRQLCDF